MRVIHAVKNLVPCKARWSYMGPMITRFAEHNNGHRPAR